MGTSCGSVGSMLTIRRSGLRLQKNVPDADENSPMLQPLSSQSSIAAMNARFRFVPADS
jgi:hypothetical protein